MRIHPFNMIRPHSVRAAGVSCPPYDVVDTDQARELADGIPESFLHVIRPEIALPNGTAYNDDAVYGEAATQYERLLGEGVLQRDQTPSLAVYRLSWEGRTQHGIVCCCHVDDYVNNVIRRHETTRPDKEDDRTRHLLSIDAQTGPVLLAYRDQPAIDELVQQAIVGRPSCHFKSADNVTHTIWDIEDTAPFIEAFSSLPCAYVADGHHRTASAVRAAEARREGQPDADPDAEFNWFMSVLFPASQLQVLPYNRAVSDLGDHDEDGFLSALSDIGSIETTKNPIPDREGVICIAMSGGWYRFTFDEVQAPQDPVASLDVALLQDRILGPMLGIADPRTDPRLQFVGGIHGPDGLKKRVDDGEAAAAFSMFPTRIEAMMDVSDASMCMPPKSTWFEPKLRSGLFVHALDSHVPADI